MKETCVISSQSPNLESCRGITDDVATVPFHLALRESRNAIHVHATVFSSHFCLPNPLAPFPVPYRIVFAMPEDLEMWPHNLTMVRGS